MPKKPKGVGKPSKAKIAADKRKQREEHLRKAQETAYQKAYKMAMIQAAKMAGREAAIKEVAKKGKGRK